MIPGPRGSSLTPWINRRPTRTCYRQHKHGDAGGSWDSADPSTEHGHGSGNGAGGEWDSAGSHDYTSPADSSSFDSGVGDYGGGDFGGGDSGGGSND